VDKLKAVVNVCRNVFGSVNGEPNDSCLDRITERESFVNFNTSSELILNGHVDGTEDSTNSPVC
jgi:hypothetical protein